MKEYLFQEILPQNYKTSARHTSRERIKEDEKEDTKADQFKIYNPSPLFFLLGSSIGRSRQQPRQIQKFQLQIQLSRGEGTELTFQFPTANLVTQRK